MVKKFLLFLFPFFLILIAGCEEYASPPRILPEYVKKIAILDFTDPLNNMVFVEKLQREVKEEFILDSRVEITLPEKADALLKGEINKYILTPVSYDSNFVVKSYKLLVWIDITLLDCVSKTILWTEKRMEKSLIYKIDTTSLNEPSTEFEAQDILARGLSKNIVKRTLDGWFEASGVSEKK